MMEKQGGVRAVQQMQILKVMDSDSLYMHHIYSHVFQTKVPSWIIISQLNHLAHLSISALLSCVTYLRCLCMSLTKRRLLPTLPNSQPECAAESQLSLYRADSPLIITMQSLSKVTTG